MQPTTMRIITVEREEITLADFDFYVAIGMRAVILIVNSNEY